MHPHPRQNTTFTGHSGTGEVLFATPHRFGFNEMEKDDEVSGEGNSLDFGARIYDSRLGRWMRVDPLEGKYPMHSPFSYCAGNPILFLDIDGRDWFVNSLTGQIIFIKDATEITKEIADKYHFGYGDGSWDRLGPNEMFGEKVQVGLYGNPNVLEQDFFWIENAENFA